MPNFSISDMAPITLPLDPATTIFEAQTVEGGIQVSRKVAASDLGIGGSVISVVGGININVDATDPLNPIVNLDAAIVGGVSVNGVLLSAAGIATNYLDETGNYSLPPGSGQVDSVVGGVNINVTGTAVDPIVNLDAAITGVSVDGVTLTTGGLATNFLNEQGNYVAVPAGGGQVDSIVAGTGITVNAGDPVNPTVNFDTTAALTFFAQMQFQQPVRMRYTIAAADSPGVGQILASGDDIFFVDQNGVSTSLLGGGGGFNPADNQTITGDWTFQGTTVFDNSADDVELEPNVSLNFRNPADNSTTFLQSLAGRMEWGIAGGGFNSDYMSFGISFASVRFPRPLYLTERPAQIAPIGGLGQIWVRTQTPNVLMFTDDLGTDFVLNAGITPWTSDIDGAGFNLDGAGVIFLTAQTAADPDVPSQGQIWVEGVPGDPLWSEVQLLADMDGADGATAYTEVSTNVAIATFQGSAELDTAQFNSGTASLLCDGVDSDITFPDIAPYDLGTQSWTIEGFVRFATLPPLQASTGPGFVLYDSRKGGSAYVQYGIIQDAFGFRVRLVGQDWGAEVGTISGGILTNTWYHWAVTRDVGGDNNIRAYFNGLYEVADFGVSPADLGNPDAPIILGSRDSTDGYLDGWLDDVRMTVGTARYSGTGAYVVPTTPYLKAPGDTNLFFTDDAGVDFQLNAAGADTSISEINEQNVNYTLLLTDAGKTIYKSAGGAGETWTIPAQASVNYPIGTWLAFYNDGGNTTSIAITTDLMRGTDGFTGTRVLGDNQRALAQKVASALWVYQATDL